MRHSRAALPAIAKQQLRWFNRYIAWYLGRNFHAVHLLRLSSPERLAGYPLLICLNHPSWWDPLLAIHLSQRLFAERQHYAPIAAAGMAKYRFFERLGFFGIEPSSPAGARRFLNIGQAALSLPDGAFWVTPQGEFTDVRQPIDFEAGVGQLASRLGRFAMLPIALEYAFWNERYPEAFIASGPPVLAQSGEEHSAGDWNRIFAGALQFTQDQLSERVQRRDKDAFQQLISGRAGIGGIYDFWRRSKARLAGKAWQPEHGGH